MLFTGLNENTFASFVVLMSKHTQLFQYLKMALITTERLMKDKKNGIDFYNKALRFCEENFSIINPVDKEEN